jgi:hypothetical protein
MRIVLILLFVLAVFPGISCANETSAIAKDIIEKAKQDCKGFENGSFEATEKAVTRHDITGDGIPEEFVDGAQFSCSTALTLFGGTCGTYLWIVAEGKKYEFLAHKWKVLDFDGQAVILLAVHPYQCSDDIGPCYRALVWQNGFRTTGPMIQ